MEDAQEQTEHSQPPPNPADRPLVTLDHNALIALRENEPDAPAVRELLAMNRAGIIILNVTMNTAMENQRGGRLLDMQAYEAWLLGLGIAKDHIFTGWQFTAFSTPEAPDAMTVDPQLDVAFMSRIHAAVFPSIPFSWFEYRDRKRERLGLPRQALAEVDRLRWYPGSPSLRPATPALDALGPSEQKELRALSAELHRAWNNTKNDALGLHNHISQALHTAHPERAVFVTSDQQLWRRQATREAIRTLGYPGEILPPARAVEHLRAITGATLP